MLETNCFGHSPLRQSKDYKPTYPLLPFKVKELCDLNDVLFNEKQIFLLDDGCYIRYGHFFLMCVLLWETQKKIYLPILITHSSFLSCVFSKSMDMERITAALWVGPIFCIKKELLEEAGGPQPMPEAVPLL